MNRMKSEFEQNRDDSERGNREMEDKLKRKDLKQRELAEELKNLKNDFDKKTKIMTQKL